MKIKPQRPDRNQVYENPFKELNIYPFNRIGRVACDRNTAEVKYRLHEDDSNLDDRGYPVDLNDLDIFVYIPKFYSKRTWDGDVLKDEISTEIPTTVQKGDWDIHPAFIRENGSVRPYILIGAFPAVEVDGQLRSVAYNKKPLVSQTIATFLSKARQGRNNKYCIHCPQSVSVMQLLFKVAFQTLYLQDYIGNGWVSKSESPVSGTTMTLGNKTGYLGSNGDDISVLGIEKPWGGIWEFVTGMYVKDDGYYFTHNPNEFCGDVSTYDRVATTPLMGNESGKYIEGYIKKILPINGKYTYMNIPKELGASSSTYYTDSLWSHRRGRTNTAMLGGSWSRGTRAGAFCLYLSRGSSDAWSYGGGRLVYLP